MSEVASALRGFYNFNPTTAVPPKVKLSQWLFCCCVAFKHFLQWQNELSMATGRGRVGGQWGPAPEVWIKENECAF